MAKKYEKPTQLGRIQLWKLRKDIILNSLFTRDYTNRYGIDPSVVQGFFDGYVEYLYELAEEDGFLKEHRPQDCLAVFKAYDSAANLWSWAGCVAAGE
jgi:hypothetical protein